MNSSTAHLFQKLVVHNHTLPSSHRNLLCLPESSPPWDFTWLQLWRFSVFFSSPERHQLFSSMISFLVNSNIIFRLTHLIEHKLLDGREKFSLVFVHGRYNKFICTYLIILEIGHILIVIHFNLKNKLYSFPLDSNYDYLERDNRRIYNE